jgi:hypothetical protein
MVDELNMNMEKDGKLLTRLFVAKSATVPICPSKAPHVTENVLPQ